MLPPGYWKLDTGPSTTRMPRLATEPVHTTPAPAIRLGIDLLLLAGFCAFLFFFGLGRIGLTGADEPRYAQIAREMLARHDWITPVLHGEPWLEKPVLYYWEAMLSYRLLGVSDWAARLPAAVNATALVLAVYLFMGRFYQASGSKNTGSPGGRVVRVKLEAALIAASMAGIVGFGHAAFNRHAVDGRFLRRHVVVDCLVAGSAADLAGVVLSVSGIGHPRQRASSGFPRRIDYRELRPAAPGLDGPEHPVVARHSVVFRRHRALVPAGSTAHRKFLPGVPMGA